ncbi:MAG: type III-B CRISPR-associated protein Cas10/Cmr2 [Proteobacteria bacterium]|nr:type III-B CRISPR-associated protein Cas10/Cmr2 [Pseudomonadota bacterium]
MTHLIKFSFGPVQDFIAAARKLEDLWAGSRMLSALMERAHEILENNGQVIYPAKGAKNVNLPNILLAESNSDPQKLAEEVVEGVQRHLEEIIRGQLCNVPFYRDYWIRGIVDRQLKGFLDFTWSAREIADEKNISKALEELNARFDAAKRTRIFRQQKEPGPKCTLQPNLSVLAPPGKADHKVKRFWRDLGKHTPSFPGKIVRAVRSDKGERFSAIGFAKRLYLRNDDSTSPFPSTYSVATAFWRYRLLKEAVSDSELDKAIEDFASRLKELKRLESEAKNGGTKYVVERVDPEAIPCITGFNGHDFLHWEPQYLTETEVKAGESDVDDPMAEVRKKLVKAAKEGIGTPPGHYALLLADGDSMGRIVDACKHRDDLVKLSEALNAFASEAVRFVESEETCGRAVYAGGDDVMAVCPVESSLKAACEWRRLYRKSLENFTFKDDDEKEQPATLSVALLIASVKYPLNRLLREAHSALDEQAKASDKDALALVVYKGDSEAASVVLPSKDENGWTLYQWAEEVADLVASKTFSSSSMYSLKKQLEAVETYVKVTDSAAAGKKNIVRSIALARLLTSRDLSEDNATDIKKHTEEFLDAMESQSAARGNDRFRRADILAKTLIVLRHIRRLSCL